MSANPNNYSVDQLLLMHGYNLGSEQERMMCAFKDLARTRAVLAIAETLLTPTQHKMFENGVKTLVDS